VQEIAENNCVYRNEIHHAAAERTQILQDVASDPTLPRTKTVRCVVCNHGEAVFFQVSLFSTYLLSLLFYSKSSEILRVTETSSSRSSSHISLGCYLNSKRLNIY